MADDEPVFPDVFTLRNPARGVMAAAVSDCRASKSVTAAQHPAVVVLCPDAGGDGGVSVVVRHHVRALGKMFPVIVLSRRAPANPTPGVEYVTVQSREFGWLRRFAHVPNELAFSRAVRARLSEIAQQKSLALVICHGHVLAALAAWPMKQDHGLAYALVVHADIFDRPRGTYDPRLTRLYRWATPVAYRNADRVIAISPHMAECAVSHGAAPSRVVIVPNGIQPEEIGIDADPAMAADADRKESRHIGTSNRPLRLLFVGRLSVEKGLFVLLDACSQLLARNVSFHVDVAGSGPLRAQAEALVKERGLSSHIVFLGARPRRELGAYYARADVTVVPSLSEPQGLVVLESLVSGTPVIAADVGGMPTMVHDGENGYLFRSGDAGRLAERIEVLWRAPQEVARLSHAARGSVWPRYSWSITGKKLVGEVAGILDKQTVAMAAE